MEPVYLHNPTFIELDDAYRSLPKFEKILLKSSNSERSIFDLEKIGFVAVEVISNSPEEMRCTIRAFKGKHGPCHFTGWKARYSGAALAALDDDNHILFKDKFKVVCEKTSHIYSLSPYKNLIVCKEASVAADLNYSIIEEESVDFENDQTLLFNQLKNKKKNSEKRKSLFYHGPFRILILQDGTLVRRGKWNSIPEEQADKLIRNDGFSDLKSDKKGQLSYFQDEYTKHGSACLIEEFNPEAIEPPAYETDFSKLSLVSDNFRTRLLRVINDQKKYFFLIGNDSKDQFGCCPSEEVSEANQLVKYGILSALAEPVKGDACPVTMYAFKDEISIEENVLSSSIQQKFRGKVRVHLKKSTLSRWQVIVKWLLLVFIMISLIFAARKWYKMQHNSTDGSLYEQLNPEKKNQSQVILFHNRKRCFQCLQMETFTRELLAETYSDELSNKCLEIRTIIIDDPDNLKLVKQFGIYAATVVLIKFDQEKIVKVNVLNEATGLYRNENTYKDYLKNELQQFLIEENE